jgi:two-component system, NtrC family, sensor kinase
MRRRSRAGSASVKSRRRKAATPKRRTAPKSTRHRRSPAAGVSEQVALFKRERDEALEQQAATTEVLRVIARSPSDTQPVFDTIVTSASRLCKARFCWVFRFDGKLIHFAAEHGLSPEYMEAIRRSYPIPPGRASAAARAVLTGTVAEIPDVQADPDYAHGDGAKTMDFRSLLAVPMLKDGHALGAVVIARTQTGRFPERQIQLLRTFADQAVIAIENVRLFEAEQQRTRELRESLERQTATSEVLKVISSSPGELEPVFQTLLGNAVRLCGAEFGLLNLKEGDGFRNKALFNVPPTYSEPPDIFRPHPGGGHAEVLRTKQRVQIADLRDTSAYRIREW